MADGPCREAHDFVPDQTKRQNGAAASMGRSCALLRPERNLGRLFAGPFAPQGSRPCRAGLEDPGVRHDARSRPNSSAEWSSGRMATDASIGRTPDPYTRR